MPQMEEGPESSPSPFRRLCARLLDYCVFGCLIQFLLIAARVHSTWRVLALTNSWLLQMNMLVLWIFTESVLLTMFQTTPGKWLCDIRIYDSNRRPLGILTAFDRSLSVFGFGLSGGIPGANLVALVQGYRDLTERGATQWDRGRYRVEAKPLTWGRRWMAAVALAVFFLTDIVMSAFGG